MLDYEQRTPTLASHVRLLCCGARYAKNFRVGNAGMLDCALDELDSWRQYGERANQNQSAHFQHIPPPAMPSGHTAGFAKPEYTFQDFAKSCLRSFCLECREGGEPSADNKPSSYHKGCVDRAKKRLDELHAMTDEQYCSELDAMLAQRHKEWEVQMEARRTLRTRYEAALEKAKAWVPPTEKHREYKKFMVKQLEESIEWDCTEYAPPPRTHASRQQVMAELFESMERHTKSHEEECERVASRNQWTAQVLESLN